MRDIFLPNKKIYPGSLDLREFLMKKGEAIPTSTKTNIINQVKIVNQYLISDLPENEFLDEFSYLKESFQDLTISLEADQPIFSKENYRGSISIVDIFWQG